MHGACRGELGIVRRGLCEGERIKSWRECPLGYREIKMKKKTIENVKVFLDFKLRIFFFDYCFCFVVRIFKKEIAHSLKKRVKFKKNLCIFSRKDVAQMPYV